MRLVVGCSMELLPARLSGSSADFEGCCLVPYLTLARKLALANVFCSAEPSNAESLLYRAYNLAPAASASP